MMQDDRARLVDELIPAVSSVPVPEHVLERLEWMQHSDVDRVLLHHPGDAIARKCDSLWNMLSLFRQSHSDLEAKLAQFHKFSASTTFRDPANEKELDSINTGVRKELMAFSFAAASLQGLSYRVRKAAPVTGYAEKLKQVFDNEEHEFITNLRDVLAHKAAPRASWAVTWNKDRARETDFTLDSWELLTYGELNCKAQSFVEHAGGEIQVRALVAQYANRVDAFYSWLRSGIEANPPAALADYRRCRRACRARAKRQWYKVLVPLARRDADPYAHLPRYLTPDEIAAALALPHRSREQVDFIIAAADKDGACDDELRALLYKFFNVPAPQD